MRRALAAVCLVACVPSALERSAPLGPEDARGPIAMVEVDGHIAVAWTAGAPLHVVTATLTTSLEADVEAIDVGRSSAEPALAASGRTLVLAFRAETETGSVVVRGEREDRSFDFALPRDQVSFAPSAYQPALVTLSDGAVVLAFDQWTDTGYGVSLATRDVGGRWTSAVDANDVVSPHVFHSNAPRLAAGSSGAALLTWYQSLGGPLLVHERERDASGAFVSSTPEGVVSLRDHAVDSHPVANPRPALGPRGEAAIAWTAEAGEDVRVYVATRREGVWTVPRDIDDALSLRGHAACAVPIFTERGDLVVAWQVDEGEGWSVRGRQRAGSVWGPSVVLFAHAHEPAITSLGEEIVVVATSLEHQGIVASRGAMIEHLGASQWVSGAEEPASSPTVLSSGGEVYVAYLAGPPFASRVRVARIE